MRPLPPTASPYHATREFTEATLPTSLVAREHATKPGVWERIRVSKGRVRCRRTQRGGLPTTGERVEEIGAGSEGVIEPGVPHRLELVGEPVRVSIEFHRTREGVRGHWSARTRAPAPPQRASRAHSSAKGST